MLTLRYAFGKLIVRFGVAPKKYKVELERQLSNEKLDRSTQFFFLTVGPHRGLIGLI